MQTMNQPPCRGPRLQGTQFSTTVRENIKLSYKAHFSTTESQGPLKDFSLNPKMSETPILDLTVLYGGR